MKYEKPLRVIAYTRVSTKEQAEQGVSLDDQLKQIQQYCKQHGHRIVATYVDDGYSRREDKRPQFMAMVDAIMTNSIEADAIFTLTVSRFFRDTIKAALWKRDLAKRGVQVVHICEDVGDGMSANFVSEILSLKAQHDFEVISYLDERGLKENATQGYNARRISRLLMDIVSLKLRKAIALPLDKLR